PDDPQEEHVARMSLEDLNREQKRMLKRQGALDERGAPTRAVRQAPRQRVGPVQYLREVRDEMRQVAWRPQAEAMPYSIIVTVCVVVYMISVGGIDDGLSVIADWFCEWATTKGPKRCSVADWPSTTPRPRRSRPVTPRPTPVSTTSRPPAT